MKVLVVGSGPSGYSSIIKLLTKKNISNITLIDGSNLINSNNTDSDRNLF